MGAGFAISFLLTPVELVKCRLQVQASDKKMYKGPIDCAIKTYKYGGGLTSLFKGHTATMLREIPGGAAYFGMYESFVKILTPAGKTKDDVPPLYLAVSGSLGGISYWTIFFPADTIKSQMQTDPSPSPSSSHLSSSTSPKGRSFGLIFRQIYDTQGVRGLYRGLGVTLLRAVPSNFCIFYCYVLLTFVEFFTPFNF